METLIGVQVGQIPVLAGILHAWSVGTDAAIDLVAQGQTLSDLSVAVTQPLLEIGADGRTMAQAIERAAAEILDHKLTITTQITPLSLVGFGAQGEVGGAHGSAGRQTDHRRSQFFREINGAQPLGTGRVDQLMELIRADTADDRDPTHRLEELNPLVGSIIGDSSPAAVASAMSMLMRGIGATQLRLLFSPGQDAAFKKIASAMANGLSPSQAGLPTAVFPFEYVEWHENDAERQRMQANIDQSWALQGLVLWGGGSTPQSNAAIEARIESLDPNDPMRAVFAQVVSGGFNFKLATRQEQAVIITYFQRSNQNLQAAFDAQSFDVQLGSIPVPTLDGDVYIQSDGSLGAFDAIGAAAATVPQVPASFVGSAYAESHGEFDFHQVVLAIDHARADEVVATSFFETLGADQVSHFVNRYAWEAALTTDDPFNPASNPLVLRLSIALGRASEHLGSSYATTLIETRPGAGFGPGSEVADPEWLFAYGDFGAGFLVSGAAASVGLHGGSDSRDINPDALSTSPFHPSALVINRVVRAELGAEFVHELHRIGAIDALVWADPPIGQPTTYPLSGEAWPEGSIPLVSHLLVQAGADDAASMLLIDSAGSRIEPLQLDVANGISHVLAGQLPRFVGAANQSTFLDAAENTFAAGAGVDIDIALRSAVIEEMREGLTHGEWEWYTRQPELGEFAGRIDGRKFRVFRSDAALADQAIENAAKWISGIINTSGIVIGVAGAPLSGGASIAMAGAGVGATSAGWVLPTFLPPADNEIDVLELGMGDLGNVANKGAALALLALALSERTIIRDGAFVARQTTRGRMLRLEMDTPSGWSSQSWLVDGDNPAWQEEAIAALDEANAFVTHEEGRDSAGVLVNSVGTWVFSNEYFSTFSQESEMGP